MPAREEPEAVWQRVRGELQREVPDFTFHIWLSPLELATIERQVIFVRAPDHVRALVRDRYLPLLLMAAQRSLAPDARVEIVDSQWRPEPPPSCGAGVDAPNLNPKYTFEQFVISKENRLAHGAALAVAELPGHTYNPLFIHGEPGLGKTHLLHAIGNFVQRHGSGLSVRYATVEEFTSEFTGAIRRREGMQAFKQRFRGVGVLLLDDVQFLEQKVKTEEELFHTFNVLKESGRQLVMTSDRSPDELGGLERRLGERFASGLVVGVGVPDLHARRAILQSRAKIDGLELSTELLTEIAAHAPRSIRGLEAALVQVVAYASFEGEPPTPELAARLLGRLNPRPWRRSCSFEDIVNAAAAQFGVPPKALTARDRRSQVVLARKVAMRLARELMGQSLPQIGRSFGGRDHTTVLSALRSLERHIAGDPALATVVDSLHRRLSDGQ